MLSMFVAGRAGEECAKADGRELGLLGESSDVAGLRDWLLSEGIDSSNVGAAYEFGLVAEGVEREGIGARCFEVVTDGDFQSLEVFEAMLRGVRREAAKGLALACARHAKGQRLRWRYVRRAYRMLEGWMRANGGANAGRDKVSWFQESVCELDFGAMPLKALREVVEGSEYVDRGWAAGVIERKEAAGDNAYEVEYKEERWFNSGISGGVPGSMIAVGGEGPDQRVAVIDHARKRVLIYHLESGEQVATAGSKGTGHGQFLLPMGIAFSGTGELYVSDFDLHRINVFDRQGRHVRVIGGIGGAQGRFNRPGGLCLTADGYLLVTDSDNNRVQVLREDGTFVRSIGSIGFGDGQFIRPVDVCPMPDGSIAVLECMNHRIQLFDVGGGFLRSVRVGPSSNYFAVHAGVGGEFVVCRMSLVSDRNLLSDVAIFSAEGELLQTVGPGGDSKVPREGAVLGVAACADGRLVIATQNPSRISVLS